MLSLCLSACDKVAKTVVKGADKTGEVMMAPLVKASDEAQARSLERIQKMREEDDKRRGIPNSDKSTWDPAKDAFPPGFTPKDKDSWKK